MSSEWTDEELMGYLNESLPAERMTLLESELRNSAALRQRVSHVRDSHATGPLSVGGVWRRDRVSCPSRRQLGSYILGALAPDWSDYIDFHIRVVGCRYCAANFADLEQPAQSAPVVESRRQKFFQSSAGYISNLRRDE